MSGSGSGSGILSCKIKTAEGKSSSSFLYLCLRGIVQVWNHCNYIAYCCYNRQLLRYRDTYDTSDGKWNIKQCGVLRSESARDPERVASYYHCSSNWYTGRFSG